MLNFAMRSAVATALVGGMMTQYEALLGGGDVHLGPKFIRVNSDGTSQEVTHISSRFVKARVQEMAEGDPAVAARAEGLVEAGPGDSAKAEGAADVGSEGRFLTAPAQDVPQAALVKGLMSMGLPQQAAALMVQTNPALARQLVASGPKPAPQMGCRVKVGERQCM